MGRERMKAHKESLGFGASWHDWDPATENDNYETEQQRCGSDKPIDDGIKGKQTHSPDVQLQGVHDLKEKPEAGGCVRQYQRASFESTSLEIHERRQPAEDENGGQVSTGYFDCENPVGHFDPCGRCPARPNGHRFDCEPTEQTRHECGRREDHEKLTATDARGDQQQHAQWNQPE